MKTLGYKAVRIDALKLPGNWREILDSDEVTVRAKSVLRVGLIHAPIVRKSDMRLVCGRRRVAACVHAGLETIEVKLIAATDEQCDELELTENLERRHADAAERARLQTALLERYEAEARKNPLADVDLNVEARGRPKTPRGRARERLAEERNIKPESVRRAEARAKARLQPVQPTEPAEPDYEPDEPDEPAEDAPVASLKAWGWDPPLSVLHAVHPVQQACGEALKTMSEIQRKLGNMANVERDLPIQRARFERVRDTLSAARSALAGYMPKMACPACKNIAEVQVQCAVCVATGWVGDEQVRLLPDEYFAIEQVVLYQGKTWSLDDLADELAPEPEQGDDRGDIFSDDEPTLFDDDVELFNLEGDDP